MAEANRNQGLCFPVSFPALLLASSVSPDNSLGLKHSQPRLFFFLRPKSLRLGGREVLNTCGPRTLPALRRELPALPERRGRLTGGWTRCSPVPTAGSERPRSFLPPRPSAAPHNRGPAAARPGRPIQPCGRGRASPRLPRAPRARCRGAANAPVRPRGSHGRPPGLGAARPGCPWAGGEGEGGRP